MPIERQIMLSSSCSRLGFRRRWRWWTLAVAGSVTALAATACGSSGPDPDLLVLPPGPAEALGGAPAAPPPEAPPTSGPVEPTSTAAEPVPTTPVAAPVVVAPEPAEEPLPAPERAPVSAPALDPVPEPVSLPAADTVPEPAEALVTASPDDHDHEHLEPAPEPHPAPDAASAPEPEPVSLLPEPVGEPILLAENTEETFIDGSGWVEARYQPIEVEIGTQLSVPGGDGSTIVTRMVDLEHNGLWDIYECDVHEAYGGPPGTGWEFVGYAYRDEDGRFRLVVGSARPVGPCGP